MHGGRAQGHAHATGTRGRGGGAQEGIRRDSAGAVGAGAKSGTAGRHRGAPWWATRQRQPRLETREPPLPNWHRGRPHSAGMGAVFGLRSDHRPTPAILPLPHYPCLLRPDLVVAPSTIRGGVGIIAHGQDYLRW